MENPNQITRSCRDWRAMRGLMRILDRAYRDDNSVSLCLNRVRMWLIEVEDYSRNQRTRTVQASAHPAHTNRIHRDTPHSVIRVGIRKIQQNPVRIRSRLKRRLHRSTQGDFHAQVRPVQCRGQGLHCRRARIVLRRGTRQQEHQSPEMFLNCRHSLLTLAGAPPAARNLAFPPFFVVIQHFTQPNCVIPPDRSGGTDSNSHCCRHTRILWGVENCLSYFRRDSPCIGIRNSHSNSYGMWSTRYSHCHDSSEMACIACD